jgi:hypothetical protein
LFLFQPTLRSPVVDFIRCVQHLYNDTNVFLTDKAALLVSTLSTCLTIHYFVKVQKNVKEDFIPLTVSIKGLYSITLSLSIKQRVIVVVIIW